MAEQRPREASERRLLASAVACATLALLTFNTVPLLIGSLIDGLGFDATRAGLVGTGEIGALAIASLGLAPFVHLVPLRLVALGAGGAVAGLQVASIATSAFGALVGLRVTAGVASGAVYAAVNAAIARTADPDRSYAKLTFAVSLLTACIFALLPFAATRFGVAGTFGTLAAVSVVCLPFALWLPRRATAAGLGDEDDAPFPRRAALQLVAGVLIAGTGGGGLWAFTERIALDAGLEIEQVGVVLGATTVVATSGALMAAWLGTRIGRTRPLLGAQGLIGVMGLSIAYSETPAAYVTAQLVYNVLFVFILPYVLGTAAALDPLGRVAAAVGGASMIGAALGPAIAGVLAEQSGYTAVGWLDLGCVAVACALYWPVTRGLDRGGAAAAAATS